MSPSRLIGTILIVAGIAGIILQRVTYTKESHNAELGPISISVDEKETVGIPMWAGIAAIVAGAGLLLLPRRRG